MPLQSLGDGPKQTIQAIENAVKIVESLETRDNASPSELAAELDMSRSTVHVYLKTLEQFGYVVNDGGRYAIGLRFLTHGGHARKQQKAYEAAKLEVDRLARETNEMADMGVEQNGLRFLLYKAETEEAVYDNVITGEYTHMHWTALGKALLAWKPRDRVEAIVEAHGLPEATEATVTTSDALFDELDTVADQGYAVEDGDRREGVASIAVPVLDTDRKIAVAALSVSGPQSRLLDGGIDDKLLEQLAHSRNVAELRYNHY
ncbi:IclR family transcriptional regulator [Natronococcus pandeyae]|uniref:IclR family transcriptional regulator n=1 Tax=Natronococcus pandeyae TaxID=2055836 RepID=A0A8J8Q2Y6_9EURY|nr:IclR family transcriptional regulator [Natronococcus pandeyae]TYL36165.1 IclR family transcriptional regulator [Natronococcus pandeyae]